MAITYTPLLKLALPTPGTETGTWGSTVNNSITALLDNAIAGSSTADVTASDWYLTDLDGAYDTARSAILIPTGTGSATKSIFAINRNKTYVIINRYAGPVAIKGVTGPTTGVTILPGNVAFVTWDSNTSDFVTVTPTLNSLGGTTIGQSLFTLANPSAVTFPRFNIDNTVSALDATAYRAALGVSGTVTSVAALTLGTSGTDVSSSVLNSTTTPVITLNLPNASAANRGVLTSADWTTFNNKQATLGTASSSVSGILSSTDWVTFNGKYSSGGVLGTPTSGTLSNCTVDGTDAVGFRNIPINSKSVNYSLVLSDSGKCIFHPDTDAVNRTFMIPANSSVAYPIGTAISFINMTTQILYIDITSDTMYLAGASSITTGTRSLALFGFATAIKMTSTTWLISGVGLS